jgi:hypothetical protein
VAALDAINGHFLSGNAYHLRSYDRDGLINTQDDVLPSAIENVGLDVNYQVLGD